MICSHIAFIIGNLFTTNKILAFSDGKINYIRLQYWFNFKRKTVIKGSRFILLYFNCTT